jgi:hypothetical protein
MHTPGRAFIKRAVLLYHNTDADLETHVHETLC